MIITDLSVNHLTEPLGYRFDTLRFQWRVADAQGSGTVTAYLRVEDENSDAVLEKTITDFPVACAFDVELSLKPYTRYFWSVEAISDIGERAVSEKSCFETAKMSEPWGAKWLVADSGAKSTVFQRALTVRKKVKKARLYICGYGLYEAYLNGKKLGDEVLLPGYHSYDLTNEYQTIDVTEELKSAKNGGALLSVMLGNGWYKGRFVFDGGYENLYGDRQRLIAELHITYENGEKEIVCTDEGWSCSTSFILDNGIYDGETQDRTAEGKRLAFSCEEPGNLLTERTSAPIREVEKIAAKTVIHTPSGDTVLDFGEMITGWVSVRCSEENSGEIRLQYGEWMQGGEFYRDNLRTAKAEFRIRSAGDGSWARPHFTYYGFRYVKVEGMPDARIEDFVASRIRSDCEKNGVIVTGNEKVNRLIANAYASQECNFLDIPTDCPQRDERMGWTGDIGIFADTACFNMDGAAFLSHYMEMVRREQEINGGAVPFIVPLPKLRSEDKNGANPFLVVPTACAWGDVATIVPFALYEHYRDKNMLRRHYPVMKSWLGFVKGRTEANHTPHLWLNDMQLGDWVALDSQDPNGLFGLTDTGFIASAYYYRSTELTLRAAEILGEEADIAALSEELVAIRKSFFEHYLDADGNLRITETQTAYAVLLSFGLCPEEREKKAVTRLRELIESNNGHLTTGFVGTPLLCAVLSKYGEHEAACRLFLNEDYPGWLYEVNLGAVSIWERWNSVNSDGTITSTDMNSLNHYAFGSVVSWVYRYLCGFTPCAHEENSLVIAPKYCEGLGFIKGEYTTPWGTYHSSWKETAAGVEYKIEVPYDGKAIIRLGGTEHAVRKGSYIFTI